MKKYGIGQNQLMRFDNRILDLTVRRKLCTGFLKAAGTFDSLAFFCHGLKTRVQAGFTLDSIDELSALLVSAGCKTVVLYACSTAGDPAETSDQDKHESVGGDGGFADTLRDKVSALGGAISVFGHINPGHATKNPNVRVFSSPAASGGPFVVPPTDPLFHRWAQFLNDTDLRFEFPWLSHDELLARLVSGSPPPP